VRGRQLLAWLGLPQPWSGTIEASLRLIDALDREINDIERELRRLGADHRYLPLLLTVPQISSVLAYTIAAEIGDISRFASPGELAGDSGLCLAIRASESPPQCAEPAPPQALRFRERTYRSQGSRLNSSRSVRSDYSQDGSLRARSRLPSARRFCLPRSVRARSRGTRSSCPTASRSSARCFGKPPCHPPHLAARCRSTGSAYGQLVPRLVLELSEAAAKILNRRGARG
jgi:hypothetical protein